MAGLRALFLLALAVVSQASHQNYPGSYTRPVLSDYEASQYTEANYLNGWTPDPINTWQIDYHVGYGQQYSSIQTAVNAAITAGGSTRKYIRIEAGTYRETVYIPATSVPLTLYGAGNSASDVHIIFEQSAQTTGSQYANTVNPNGQRYKNGDPAYSMYKKCAKSATIGTSCSSIVWIKANNVQVTKVTFENPSTAAQAVAVQTQGDKIQFDNVQFFGFQDTLYANSRKRVYFNNVVVKGDVDFIFGSARAVFKNSHITGRGDRRNTALVFAPSTEPGDKYGYLVVNSEISADSNVASANGLSLARAWDRAVSKGTYNPGVSPNGQLVIRETTINAGLNVYAAYSTSTSGRAFSTSISTDRNLDDNTHNRFWEYRNTGPSA